jgi:hypothetical protein
VNAVAGAISIHYSRDVGWAGSLIVELCKAEPSHVLVTFNYDQRPEIGVYQAPLAEGVFAQVLAEVQRSGYPSLAPPGPFPPESKFVVVGERLEGAESPAIHAFDVRALPPGIASIQAHVERVVDGIRRHRSRVVEGKAAWTKPAFDTVEPIAARVTLKNTGALPMTLANPLSAGREAGLMLVLADAAGATESVELDVAQLRGSPGLQDGLVTLAPGDALAFALTKKVYLRPGDYMARLSYRSLVDVQGDPQFVGGELWLEVGRFRVQHRWPS